MKNRYAIFTILVIIVLALDQITKGLVLEHFLLHETKVVIDGFANITHVRNPGAAFGLLATASPGFRTVFFLGAKFLAMGLILYYLIREGDSYPESTLPLALIFSGAGGNLIDRLRFGEVVDFVDLHLGPYHWPTFNIADGAISLGAIFLVFLMIKGKRVPDRRSS